MELQVVKAARFVAWLCFQKNISFGQFTFPDDSITQDNTQKFDCIVLVNWIHLIPPAVLKANIEKYFRENRSDDGMIILDTVPDPEYRFNHDIHFLTSGLSCTIEKIGDYERQREVWAIRSKKT
jgi:hypothetical protein